MASQSGSQAWSGDSGASSGVNARNRAAGDPMDRSVTVLDSSGNDSSFGNGGMQHCDLESSI